MSAHEQQGYLPSEADLEEFLRRLQEGDEEAVARLRALTIEGRERERSLRELLRDPYVVTDPEGRIREMNAPAVDLLGAAPLRDVQGGALDEFIVEARREIFRDRLSEVNTGPDAATFETVVSRPNRQPVRVEATAVPMLDGRGDVVAIRWLLRDLSDEHRADQTARQLDQAEAERAAAERAEYRLRILSETSRILGQYLESAEPLQEMAELLAREHADHCAIWLAEDGELREAARAGDLADDAAFLPARERLCLDPEDPESALRAAIATGRPHVVAATDADETRMEPVAMGSSGPGGPRRVLVAPLRTSGGPEGALVLVDQGVGPGFGREDMVLAEQLSARITTAVEQARLFQATVAARSERDHVRRVVSHDLRNALNAVIVSLEQAGVGSDDSGEGSVWLGRAYDGVQRMARLLDDLDQLTDRSQARLELQRSACRPEDLLREAAETFQGMASRKNIELRRTVDPDLPPVDGDRGRIVQVLSNLVENALRFTPTGGEVRLGVARAEEGERNGDEDFLAFSVEDTGPGIPVEDLDSVFKQFWSRGPGGRGSGSGLGLAIARNLVEAHGGTIRAENTEEGGARVVFTLPVAGPEGRA